MKEKYGLSWPDQEKDFLIEAWCYRNKHPVAKGGLGAAGHFKQLVNHLWGPHNKRKHFIWHPWAEEMNEAIHEGNITAFSGCGSSGKSDMGAIWSIVNWLVAPCDTLVLQTSTGLKEAKGRIWGATVEYFEAVEGLPGRLTPSTYTVATRMDNGEIAARAGIWLIAAAQKYEREAVNKIIGIKNKRIYMVADELPDISPAVPEAFFGNIATNPHINQPGGEIGFLGLGNFKSRYDPFGELTRPKAGWDSINVNSDRWETEKGICVRFDGLKSPNIISGKDEWPIYGSKNLAAHRKNYRDTEPMFWRMCRSFEAPIGTEQVIYAEADLLSGNAYQSCIWLVPSVRVSSLDPSFTNGGDRCVQWIGEFGQSHDGRQTLLLLKYFLLRVDVTKKINRDYQIAHQFRDNCKLEGIPPELSAMDVTGAGQPLHSIICEEWYRGEAIKKTANVFPVNFSGSPSDTFVRASDATTAKDQFDRRVSELWWVGREFIRYGQLRGITDELAREMKARKYDHRKGPEGLKIMVETKAEMKERLQFSPDLADSAFVLVDLCRQKLGWLAGGIDSGLNADNTDFQAEMNAVNEMYANARYLPEAV